MNILEVITKVAGRDLDKQPPDDSKDWIDMGNVWANQKTGEFAMKPKSVPKYDDPDAGTPSSPPPVGSNNTTPSNTTPNASPTPVAAGSIIWPAGDKSKVNPTRHFGAGHSGVDILVPTGTPVVAPEDGTITETKLDKLANGNLGPAGLYVKLLSKDKKRVHSFLHLSVIECVDNQVVKKGARIGASGGDKGARGAGNSTGAHLHWSVVENGSPTDPIRLVNNSTRTTRG